MNEYVTPQVAAEYLSVSPRTLRDWVADGRLPGYRLGGRLLRFKLSDLDALARRIGEVA